MRNNVLAQSAIAQTLTMALDLVFRYELFERTQLLMEKQIARITNQTFAALWS
ncbi:MAG: hypothetical protein KA205_06290 [Acidobacteria bacterium]|nr:hypothetical protein [Acidobacteriota bacterium]